MMRLNIQGWLNKIKANSNFSNVDNSGGNASNNLNSAGIITVVSVWRSGSSWYRVFSDGWIEQGGMISSSDGTGFRTVNFYKAFDMGGNPNIQITIAGSYYAAAPNLMHICNAQTKSNTGFTTFVDSNLPIKYWVAYGKGA